MSTESTTVSSREFNHDTGGAKRAAQRGPVFVTDRGEPAYVLMTYDKYREMTGGLSRLVDTLCRTPGVGDVDFDVPRRADPAEPADLD